MPRIEEISAQKKTSPLLPYLAYLHTRVILEMLRLVPIPQIPRLAMPLPPLLTPVLNKQLILLHDSRNQVLVLNDLHSQARRGMEGDVAVEDPGAVCFEGQPVMLPLWKIGQGWESHELTQDYQP